jgi:hypothetical protein
MNYPLARILIIIGLFSGCVWGTEEEPVDPRIHSVEFGLLPLASTKEHLGETSVFASACEILVHLGLALQ